MVTTLQRSYLLFYELRKLLKSRFGHQRQPTSKLLNKYPCAHSLFSTNETEHPQNTSSACKAVIVTNFTWIFLVYTEDVKPSASVEECMWRTRARVICNAEYYLSFEFAREQKNYICGENVC